MLQCSFCDKTDREVARLIAGFRKTYICNECVLVAMDIVNERESVLEELKLCYQERCSFGPESG